MRRQRTSGQWFTGGAGTHWFFDAGSLSLDFAQTGGVESRPEWEQLRTPRDLADWLRGRVEGYDGRGSVTRPVLAQAVELRAAVLCLTRRLAAQQPLGQRDVDVVNRLSVRPDVPPVLPGGSGAGRSATVLQALATVARDAVDVLVVSPERVHACAADNCPLVFLDLSRAGNRRWCSMQRCGNRHKVRSHRARVLEPAAVL